MELRRRDFEPMGSGDFRTKLMIESFRDRVFKVMEEFKLGYWLDIDGEQVLLFSRPIRLPDFRKFYIERCKITDVRQNDLKRVVKDMLFLNPKPSDMALKNMATFVVRYFVHPKHQHKVTHEKVREIFDAVELGGLDDYLPMASSSVFYSAYSKFTQAQRTSITQQLLRKSASIFVDQGIRLTIEYLDKTSELKITKPRIIKHSDSVTEIPVTRKTYGKGISPEVVDWISEINQGKLDVTEKQYPKYLKAKELLDKDPNTSTSELVRVLRCSRTIAVEFKNKILCQKESDSPKN